MLKLLKKLLGFSNSGVDGLGLEIRELIKGKEIDPQKLIGCKLLSTRWRQSTEQFLWPDGALL